MSNGVDITVVLDLANAVVVGKTAAGSAGHTILETLDSARGDRVGDIDASNKADHGEEESRGLHLDSVDSELEVELGKKQAKIVKTFGEMGYRGKLTVLKGNAS